MPSKNVIKDHIPESYYHVYARGNNKQDIFIKQGDYGYFLGLLERYLSKAKIKSRAGVLYPNFIDRIELLSYCLMSNHFHILIYQFDKNDMEKLMRSLMTSYSRYFNLKYKRTGSVFNSRYRAVKINQDSYLLHISRYIHLNPENWEDYKYSSWKYYVNRNEPDWLKPEKIFDLFTSQSDYYKFVYDYKEERDKLAIIKKDLKK